MKNPKLRITHSKGRQYVQRVLYEWDPIKKRGITKIIEHLGPLEPINSSRYSKEDLEEINYLIKKNSKFKNARKREKIKESEKKYPPLTPPNWIIDEVVKIITESHQAMNRREVYKMFRESLEYLGDDEDTAKKHVGFALTIAERKGLLVKTGKGKKGSAFKYFPHL